MVESYSVVITKKARASLIAITDYLTENASEQTAEYVYFGILDAIDDLIKMPTAYSIERHISNEKRTFRYNRKWKYHIVFYINEEKKLVEIMDVVHSSRDLEAYYEQQQYDDE